MEYLQAVLRYKFWISFGAAIVLPAVGWYLATGTMATEVKKRWTTVDTKFKSDILTESKIATTPNDKYIQGVKEIAKLRTDELSQARNSLRDAQKQYMVWPTTVSETMATIGYRQAPPDPDAPFRYGNVYRQELERVLKIVSPYDDVTKKGIVYAPLGILPHAQDDSWPTMGVPIDRMWDAQEDVWLLTSIMQAIANVNKDATSIVDAPIKAIQEVSLRGGSKVAPPTPAAATGPGGTPAPATPAPRAAAAGLAVTGSAGFNPVEEFGPEQALAAPTKAGPTGPNLDDDDPALRKRNAKAAQQRKDRGEGKGGRASAPVATVNRYIDGSNTTPSKTRGFYLVLAVEHTFVPELVSQLSNMPWPTEIVRVQQADEVSHTPVAGRTEGGAGAGGPAAAAPGGFGGAPSTRGGQINIGGSEDEEAEQKAAAEEAAKVYLESPTKKGGVAGAADKDIVTAALEDPYLGMVAIAGVMTIYNQPTDAPKPQPAAQAQPTPAEAPQQPAATAPAATQGAAGATQAGANPAPNQAKPQANPATPPQNTPTASPQQGAQQPKKDQAPAKGPAPPKPAGNAAAPAPAKSASPPAKTDGAEKKSQPSAPAKK